MVSLLSQAPYSLDPALADSYLFSKMKRLLKGCKFQSADEMKEAMVST
jgi:hypothetical protein